MSVTVALLVFCLSSVYMQAPQFVFCSATDGQPAAEDSVQPDVLSDLRAMVVEQREQLRSSQRQIEELKKLHAGCSRVAFTFASGINGFFGPAAQEVTIIFTKQITNTGNAYSPVTGVFTAPVRGVYYFRFSLAGRSISYRLAVSLFKNQEKILDGTKNPTGNIEYAAGGATLLLNQGDKVYVKLRGQSQISDNDDNHCTFSGFLLFTEY